MSAIRSDFRFWVTDGIVIIIDNNGLKSVTNDIKNVLKDIARALGCSISGRKVIYRDSEGNYDGVFINSAGEFDGFYSNGVQSIWKAMEIAERKIKHE